MDNKYYQPTIEEFFVGFECEFKSFKNSGDAIFIEQWDKNIIGLHTFQKDSYEQLTYNSNWRVRYLSEQDILDLGFKYTNNDLDLVKIVKDKTNRIRFRTIDNEPHLRIYEKSERSYKDEWLPIFIGKIKNKNELIKLLKQLEIQ